MNYSDNDLVNITSNGNDLSDTLSTILFFDTILLTFYLLIGVSINFCAVFLLRRAVRRTTDFLREDNLRYQTFFVMIELTACVIGTSSFIAINTNPVDFYGESLCTLMLGSNMLFANLSGSSIVHYHITSFFRYMLVFIRHKQMMILRYSGVVFALIFSIPSFIFYGETDIDFEIQNITVSGKICGVSRKADNYSFVQAYPIVVLTIYIIEFLFIVFVSILVKDRLSSGLPLRTNKKTRIQSGFKYPTTSKIRVVNSGTVDNSKPPDNSKIIDLYADKDCSVVDLDVLTCSSCNETKRKTCDRLLASNYDLIMEQKICISDITKSSNQTPVEPEYMKIKTTKECCISCHKKICFRKAPSFFSGIILFATSTLPRAIIMILESNDKNFWSKLSKTEYMLYNFLYRVYLLQCVLHPFIYYWYAMKGQFKREIRRCRLRNIDSTLQEVHYDISTLETVKF